MRLVIALILLVGLLVGSLGVATADATLARRYAGHVVISPDPIPTEASELAAFAKANLAKDRHYDLVKGPPWDVNLLGFLSKDPGKQPVSLVFTDAKDPRAPPIASIEVGSKQRIVITKASATIAAGFEVGHTYLVRLMRGKTVLARCELTLREL